VTRSIPLKEIKVLTNGIGGTSIPIEPHSLLRGDYLQKVAQLPAENIPAVFQVVMERLGLVLGENNNLVYLRIDTVAQGQVDEAIDPTERDSRFGAVPGEWHEPFAPTTSHNKGEHVFHGNILIL
jgi:hypothetical protein